MISLPVAEDDTRIPTTVCDDDTLIGMKNCQPCSSWQDVFSGNCCLVDELQRQACQHYLSEQLSREDDGGVIDKRTRNSFLGKRPRNTFLGKRSSNEDDVTEDKRGRNSFLGKRLAFDELEKRARNMFLGKRSDDSSDDGDLQFYGDLAKRARNTFLGKRDWETAVLDKRNRNKFLGKRSRNNFLGKRESSELDDSLLEGGDYYVNAKPVAFFEPRPYGFKRGRNSFLGK